MTAVEGPLNIVVAHPGEAAPLVELLELSALPDAPFKAYRNDRGVTLLVSGMGQAAATAAVSFLAGRQDRIDGDPVAAWLNVGIAGHPDAALGSALLAHKIRQRASGRCCYPIPLPADFPSALVITVDEPELQYPEAAAYEMEAFAFWQAATTATTAELVQVLKIVSDNRDHPAGRVDLALVQKLMAGQGDNLLQLCAQLQALAAEHNRPRSLPPAFQELMARARFSVTQRHQLRRLCQRFRALGLEELLLSTTRPDAADSRQILAGLEAVLQEQGY